MSPVLQSLIKSMIIIRTSRSIIFSEIAHMNQDYRINIPPCILHNHSKQNQEFGQSPLNIVQSDTGYTPAAKSLSNTEDSMTFLGPNPATIYAHA